MLWFKIVLLMVISLTMAHAHDQSLSSSSSYENPGDTQTSNNNEGHANNNGNGPAVISTHMDDSLPLSSSPPPSPSTPTSTSTTARVELSAAELRALYLQRSAAEQTMKFGEFVRARGYRVKSERMKSDDAITRELEQQVMTPFGIHHGDDDHSLGNGNGHNGDDNGDTISITGTTMDTMAVNSNSNSDHVNDASSSLSSSFSSSSLDGANNNNNNGEDHGDNERRVSSANHDRTSGYVDRAISGYEGVSSSNHPVWAANAMNALGEIALVISPSSLSPAHCLPRFYHSTIPPHPSSL
jgi:hypothetical protein